MSWIVRGKEGCSLITTMPLENLEAGCVLNAMLASVPLAIAETDY